MDDAKTEITKPRCAKCRCFLRNGNTDKYCTLCGRRIRLTGMGLQRQSFLLEDDPDFAKL